MNWNNLTMEQRSNLMKLYLKHGITSLDTMKEHYNQYAEGGHLFDKGGKTNNDKNDEEYTFVTPSWGNTGYVVPGTTLETSSTIVVSKPKTEAAIDKEQGLPVGTTHRRNELERAQKETEYKQAYISAPKYSKEVQDEINEQQKVVQMLQPVNSVLDVAEYVPVIGDAVTVGRVLSDASNGEYTSLATLPLIALANKIPGGKQAAKQGIKQGTMAAIDASAIKNAYNINFFEKLYYQNLISGNNILKNYGFNNSVKDIQKGLDDDAIQLLRERTLSRNIRDIEESTLPKEVKEKEIKKLKEDFEEGLSQVSIGRFTVDDYKRAGQEHSGGFYNEDNNFISINTGSSFPEIKIQSHEGRHLLDAKAEGSISKDRQNYLLETAFDKDFDNIPSWKNAPEWLKNYTMMDKERVTTNRDARDELLDVILDKEKEKLERKLGRKLTIEEEDFLIQGATDDQIFAAIKYANGYGRAYIEYLTKNKKLTKSKARQHRNAMQKVGAVALPLVGTGALGMSALNSQNNNTYIQGGSIHNGRKTE